MLTPQDYMKYPHHTKEAIEGIKLIQSLRDKVLLAVLHMEPLGYFQAVLVLLGYETNPNWIMMRVADEAYERGLITESQWDVLGEKYG